MKLSIRAAAVFYGALLIFTLSVIQGYAAELTGKITGIKGNDFYIEMSSRQLPRKGDSVTIILDLDGEGLEAGKAEVIEASKSRVTARTTEGNSAIDMKVLIQTSGPIEYMFEIPGNEFQYKGKTYWYPNSVIRFNSINKMEISESYSNPLSFPGGGYFSRPEAHPAGKSLKKGHREYVSRFTDMLRDHGDEVQFIWQDRKVQGVNTVVYVSQAIITETIMPMDPEEFAKLFPDFKYTNSDPTIRRDQEFTISGVIPAPPPDNRIHTEHFWNMKFRVPDDFDEQYRPEYWEKILLEILKSVSIDIN